MKIFGFDYDGTIINIEPQKAEAFGLLLNQYWGADKEEAKTFWLENAGTSRRHKFNHFYKKIYNKDLADEFYNQIESEYSSRLKNEFYTQVKVLPGALDVLKFVRENFDFVFVSSGVTHEEINYLVQLNGLDEYFNRVLGTNQKYLSKRDHFTEILNELSPSVFIFAGDGLEDMKAAKEYGATTVGVPTFFDEKPLRNAGADYVVQISDMKGLIKEILNQKA